MDVVIFESVTVLREMAVEGVRFMSELSEIVEQLMLGGGKGGLISVRVMLLRDILDILGVHWTALGLSWWRRGQARDRVMVVVRARLWYL